MMRHVCLTCEREGKRAASVSVAWIQTHLRNQHAPSLAYSPDTVRTEPVPQ
jgi:hypothetical protein